MTTPLAPLVLVCLPAMPLREQLTELSRLTDVQILFDWNEPALEVWSPRYCWPAGTPPATIMTRVLMRWPALYWDVVNLTPTYAVTLIPICDPLADVPPLPPCLPSPLIVVVHDD